MTKPLFTKDDVWTLADAIGGILNGPYHGTHGLTCGCSERITRIKDLALRIASTLEPVKREIPTPDLPDFITPS